MILQFGINRNFCFEAMAARWSSGLRPSVRESEPTLNMLRQFCSPSGHGFESHSWLLRFSSSQISRDSFGVDLARQLYLADVHIRVYRGHAAPGSHSDAQHKFASVS